MDFFGGRPAVVETGSVIAKLKASNISIKEVDGKGLFAEVVSKMDSEKDAAALLKKSFEGFPNSIMAFSVAGKPNILDKNEKFATVEIPIKIEVNMNSFKAYVKQMDNMLSKMAVITQEFVFDFNVIGGGFYNYLNEGRFDKFISDYVGIKEDFFGKILDRKNRDIGLTPYYPYLNKNLYSKGKNFHVFILNTQQNLSGTAFKFKFFVLDKILSDEFMDSYFSSKNKMNLKLAFLTGEKEVVSEKDFLVPTVLHYEEKRGGYYNALWITPLILVNSYEGYFCSHLIAKPKIEVSLDDLQKVKDVKIEAISK